MTGLEQMLNELESNELVTILAPSKRSDRREHDMIRVNLSENCKWYRTFCAKYASSRKRRNSHFDTCIKRHRTLAALKAMIADQRSTYYFDELTRISRTFK